MQLDWYHCKGGVWCELNKLDIEHEYLQDLSGVYIIWAGSAAERNFIKVGFGDIQDELRANRSDLAVQAFARMNLYVTWAEVGNFKLKSVYNFLVENLKPKLFEKIDKSGSTKVNLPW